MISSNTRFAVGLLTCATLAIACSDDDEGDDTSSEFARSSGQDASFGNADGGRGLSGDGGQALGCIEGADMPDEFGRLPCPVPDAGSAEAGADGGSGPGDTGSPGMDGGSGTQTDAATATCDSDDDGGCTGDGETRCVLGGRCRALSGGAAGKLDLLFMIDNSGSMREEHLALQEQIPSLMRMLTSGDRDGDGIADFVPATDVHLGVVSSDMGLVGIQGIPGCEGLGDDGILNSIPSPAVPGCQPSYPMFLSYTPDTTTPQQIADDFRCVGSLGTEGCGFEQQLESVLKAVTPSTSPIRFLGDANGFGRLGHGDGVNAGFVRSGAEGSSVVAIVVVTDEEDCSSRDTRHFTPDQYLPPGDPLTMQDLNLRCFYNPNNLYSLTRYLEGLKALRPEDTDLVIYGAIVGIPPDLVDESALAAVDFRDPIARDAFYDGILADPRMQAVPDPTRTPAQGGNLTPSCITANGRAYPPRRFVELAKGFGEASIVQSICQEDFTPVADAIVGRISDSLGGSCLAWSLPRSAGEVPCEVVFELAPAGTVGTSVHSCNDLPYLATPSNRPTTTAAGREVCIVDQVPVVDTGSGPQPQTGLVGWYYDDFSAEASTECSPTVGPRRIAFCGGAAIVDGANAYLDCAP
ncbi:MAG: hypothetical protein OEZ06_25395 [Myxococcales bacterium]|nr:hypothetical protein [Myxococcales bacterium]